jgi:hypothetical protein
MRGWNASCRLWSHAPPKNRGNKNTGQTYLLPDDGKCLRYYFYFIDEDLGLGYVRVPT